MCRGLFLLLLLATETGVQAKPRQKPSASPTPTLSPSPFAVPSPSLTKENQAPNSPPGGAQVPVTALTPDMRTRLEIFLDTQSFGPGEIGGKAADFIGLALSRYQMAQGKDPQPNQVDTELHRELNKIDPVYIGYTFTKADQNWIGRLPHRPSAMASLKKAIYRSPLDFIAERFHSSHDFIRKLNPKIQFDRVKPGIVIQVPNVQPFQIETVVPVPDAPLHPEFSQRIIQIDTKARMLDLREGDRLIASFPITPGSQRLPAPVGTWEIAKITILPNFRWDEAMLQHGRRSSDYYLIAPGPRNPVGIVWIGLNKKGIGIHGTDNPETIGRSASHGCIRLANWDAIRLAGQVTVGMTVKIF
jgi:lipoprotein-anchoring transpeptidase ErfK/SrfK